MYIIPLEELTAFIFDRADVHAPITLNDILSDPAPEYESVFISNDGDVGIEAYNSFFTDNYIEHSAAYTNFDTFLDNLMPRLAAALLSLEKVEFFQTAGSRGVHSIVAYSGPFDYNLKMTLRRTDEGFTDFSGNLYTSE